MHIQVSQARILASTSVPFRQTTMQMPNSALIETKRITVYVQLAYQPRSKWIKNDVYILYLNSKGYQGPDDIYKNCI